MRKCDICNTPIPLGTNKCPNCGYVYKKEKVANGQDQFQLHEGMSFKRTNLNDHMRQFVQHPFDQSSKRNKTSNPKSRKFKLELIIIGIVIFFGLIIEGAGMFIQSTDPTSTKDSLIGTIIEQVKDKISSYSNSQEEFDNYNQLYDSYPDLALAFNKVYTSFTNHQFEFGYKDASSIKFYVEKNKLVNSWVNHEIDVDGHIINSFILADMYSSPNCTQYISYVNSDGLFDSSDAGLIYIFNIINTNLNMDYNKFYEEVKYAFDSKEEVYLNDITLTYLPVINNDVDGYELLITRSGDLND